jgi:SAM-dependent methyltransferase
MESTKSLSDRQLLQENEYDYPYHYIPSWDGIHFSQTQSLSWGYEYFSYLYFILEKAEQIGFESLLDLGCGDGRFLKELNQRNSGKQTIGLDYSQRAIAFARIMNPNIEWVCGDVSKSDLFDFQFDIITLIETLEHIEPSAIANFLQGASQYLKNDGYLLLTVPSNNIKVQAKHYQHFDLDSLKNVLSPFFTVKEVHYLNHKTSRPLRLMQRILYNRFFILNHQGLLQWLYNYYRQNLLLTDAKNCRRLALVCQKNV